MSPKKNQNYGRRMSDRVTWLTGVLVSVLIGAFVADHFTMSAAMANARDRIAGLEVQTTMMNESLRRLEGRFDRIFDGKGAKR